MAVIVLYLETLPEGVIRFQALTVIQLELGILFIVLGATGLSKKLNMILPPALKGGIVLGAGINSVVARMSEGGALDTATIACLGGLVVVCLFMFSQRIREKCLNIKFWHFLATTASCGAFCSCSLLAAFQVTSNMNSRASSS